MKKPVLLQIEDDYEYSQLLSIILGNEFTVLRSENGFDGLATFLSNSSAYDLIICDSNLPELGGNEVIKLIREFNKEIPIVANSSDGNESLMDAGADYSLEKSEVTLKNRHDIISSINKILAKKLS